MKLKNMCMITILSLGAFTMLSCEAVVSDMIKNYCSQYITQEENTACQYGITIGLQAVTSSEVLSQCEEMNTGYLGGITRWFTGPSQEDLLKDAYFKNICSSAGGTAFLLKKFQ